MRRYTFFENLRRRVVALEMKDAGWSRIVKELRLDFVNKQHQQTAARAILIQRARLERIYSSPGPEKTWIL
ncbi:uncharacterized protein CLUP02_01099 [Colletotrichum lupini]|uniref:Uncharacterized protein n=1 Tax=Colletotrichum lupini TaxID=145971 RepID=A0A9Q8SCB9_9PEZI|nr:uncharacterized protein CLUP02_01099 [Colletotrichum lupini]UQC74448.1 hypothetical protein CLUP02_01099 [Colletotrichum lupini]